MRSGRRRDSRGHRDSCRGSPLLRPVGGQLVELLDRPASIEEVARVSLGGHTGQFDYPDRGGLAVERGGHLLAVVAAVFVVVDDDDGVAVPKRSE